MRPLAEAHQIGDRIAVPNDTWHFLCKFWVLQTAKGWLIPANQFWLPAETVKASTLFAPSASY